jgi:hypothetical protein
MPKKAKQPELVLYVAADKYDTLTYIEEGHEDDRIQVQVTVRRNLTNAELETIEVEPLPPNLSGEELKAAILERDARFRQALAPFVVGWNVGYRTPSGEAVQAEPPATGGWEQFGRYLPPRIVGRIAHDLQMRSTGLVKAARSTPPERGDDTSGDANSTPTGTEEA